MILVTKTLNWFNFKYKFYLRVHFFTIKTTINNPNELKKTLFPKQIKSIIKFLLFYNTFNFFLYCIKLGVKHWLPLFLNAPMALNVSIPFSLNKMNVIFFLVFLTQVLTF